MSEYPKLRRATIDYLTNSEPDTQAATDLVRDARRFVERIGECLASNVVDFQGA